MLLSYDQSLFYLKPWKEYYLVLGTEKSRERAIGEILMIDEVVGSRVYRMKCRR
jgi:hypothetical protein